MKLVDMIKSDFINQIENGVIELEALDIEIEYVKVDVGRTYYQTVLNGHTYKGEIVTTNDSEMLEFIFYSIAQRLEIERRK